MLLLYPTHRRRPPQPRRTMPLPNPLFFPAQASQFPPLVDIIVIRRLLLKTMACSNWHLHTKRDTPFRDQHNRSLFLDKAPTPELAVPTPPDHSRVPWIHPVIFTASEFRTLRQLQ